MSRTGALYRGLFGVVYLPIYAVALYPIVLAAGIVLAAIGILYTIITKRESELSSRFASNAWQSISQPVTWIFSGNPGDKPSWVP